MYSLDDKTEGYTIHIVMGFDVYTGKQTYHLASRDVDLVNEYVKRYSTDNHPLGVATIDYAEYKKEYRKNK